MPKLERHDEQFNEKLGLRMSLSDALLGPPYASTLRVIRDAVQITRRLGFTHLWVKKYYINKADSDKLVSQIYEVDLIYMYSPITLIKATTDDRTDGPQLEARAVTSLQGLTSLDLPEPCHNEVEEAL